jgi:hypothetical protein
LQLCPASESFIVRMSGDNEDPRHPG